MILELKRYRDEFFNNSTEPYTLYGVKDITPMTEYGENHFAINIFDRRVFITSNFEYVKDVESNKYFIKNGKWIGELDSSTSSKFLKLDDLIIYLSEVKDVCLSNEEFEASNNLSEIIREIENGELPTINIVNCKDCKYFYTKPNYCSKLCSDDIEDNSYCNFGMRKECN